MNPPLCYGTNVHPAEDLPSLLTALRGPAAEVRRRALADGGLDPGLGLWIPLPVARALAGDADAVARVRAALDEGGLRIDTVNAFPAGPFHGPRVKERAYAPPWGDPARLDYTVLVARALDRLLPPGARCVVSTLPGTWRPWSDGPAPGRDLARGVVQAARIFRDLAARGGPRLVLAPEPEPGCTLEGVDDALRWWHGDLAAALAGEVGGDDLREHLGICLDLCHAAVTGTAPLDAWLRLRAAGVPVAKIQISAALELPDPAAPGAVDALRPFAEPRWLHQVGARDDLGTWHRAMDLPDVLADLPRWLPRRPWRIHFHAPLDAETVQRVPTTARASLDLLRHLAVHGTGPGAAPAFEIETYTWSAIPGTREEIPSNIAAELRAVAAGMAGQAWARGCAASSAAGGFPSFL